jgi:hypothetical protein
VWPDLYERTQDIWVTGSIVLMQVRVRERGERISAGVQEASQFTDGFVPPEWLSYVTMDVPAPGQRGRNGNGKGNGFRNGNAGAGAAYNPLPSARDAAPAFEETPPYESPPYETAPYDAAPPAYDNAPPAAYEPPAEESQSFEEPSTPPAPVVTRPMPLRLVMEETEDEAGDQKRLSALFGLLQERPGADPVYLTIRTRDGDAFDLQLPSAALDEGLKESLRSLLDAPVGVA